MNKIFFRNFALLSIALLSILNSGCVFEYTGFCTNSVKQETVSPDKMLKAVVFERSCTAPSEISTQISLMGADEKLGNGDLGNVFVQNHNYTEEATADGKRANVEVKWTDANKIIVSFDDYEQLKVSRMKQSFEYVKIVYDKRRRAINPNTNQNANN